MAKLRGIGFDKLNVVLAGCGGIANVWLEGMKDFTDVRIAGLVDIRRESMEAIRSRFNLGDVVMETDLTKAIAATGARAVFDCTVPSAHPEITLEALAQGCHVLGEKPMAESLKQARNMILAARKASRIYAVIQNRRYTNNILRFRALVQSGKIGELTTLNADLFSPAYVAGFRRHMKHPFIMDMAIHSFDEARLISGQDPVSVYCREWNPKGSWFDRNASAIALFEMAGGVQFCFRGSWVAAGLITSADSQWRAVGTNGSAIWDGLEEIRAETPRGDKKAPWKTRPVAIPKTKSLRKLGHAGIIREFVDCIREGRTPQTVATDNIKSLAMAFAAIESAETGKKVAVNA